MLAQTRETTVVLGHSCQLENDVHAEACQRENIPIQRRESGGGTVLLAPGCYIFQLTLHLGTRPHLYNVEASYDILLNQLAPLLGCTVAASDLLHNGRKVSGNAQRRTRHHLIHHGTLLCEMDLKLVGNYLKEPARRPAHRGSKTHTQFLANLSISQQQVREVFQNWSRLLAVAFYVC